MPDIFVSYARSTEAQARATTAALRASGYSVWVDQDLPSHRAYSEVIEEQLVSARAVVVIWSAEAARSHWVRSEANRARESEKLVQLTIDRSPLPMPFDQIHCTDLSGWSGEGMHPNWPRVAASIEALIGPGVAGPSSDAGSARATPDHAAGSAHQGERRHLSMLFCNLMDAARIAESLDPEQWRDVATHFQRGAAHASEAMGGHVAKYLGDGLIVYFGYPVAQEDSAERAVRAGLAVLESMKALNNRFASSGAPALKARIAVHTGTVVVAEGGGSEVDMFGAAPRIASAAQAVAEPDTVVLTNATHQLVSGLFEFENLGARAVAGLDAPLQLYRAMGQAAEGARGRGFSPREATPFVGREEELHLLESRWKRVRDGDGQLVLAMGEPGIGKSRLVNEFRARIADGPHQWFEFAGAALFGNTPFHAVTRMLELSLGSGDDKSPEARVGRLEAALGQAGLDAAEAVPLVAKMLNLPVPATYAPLTLAPDQRRVRLLAALAGWVFAGTRDHPSVIVVEDLHWVDPSTMELIQTLAEQGGTAPLMLLMTARPEFRPPWPTRGHHVQVTLGRLDPRQTRKLVEGVIARAGLDPEVVEGVIARTDGVPLFAEELTRLMLDGHAGGVGREIPATLQDSLAARLDRLGRARDLAQLCSVLGREFSYELLRAVSQSSDAELHADLARLADAELIYARGLPPDATYRFKHALTQDAAYDALLKSRRRELHALVARTIADRFSSIAEAQPEMLARHWTQAGETKSAIDAWKAAGDAAYERRAFKEAEEGYRQALTVLTTQPESPERDVTELELRSVLNRVLQLTRGYAAPETVEATSRARALAEKTGSLSQLIREEARIWQAVITSGDYAAAAALADHVLDLARTDGENPTRLVFAYNAQLQTKFYTGDLAGVEEQFALLSPLIDTLGKRQAPGNNVISIGVASLAAWALGRAALAEERLARANAFAEETKNPYDLAMTLHFRGIVYACERDPARTEAVAAELADLAERNGFSYARGLALGVLGWALAQRGATAEGQSMQERSFAGLAVAGALVGQTFGLMQIAEVQTLEGRHSDALETVERALTVNPQERAFLPGTLRLRGDLRSTLGDAEGGELDYREALAVARSMGAKAWELRAALSLTRCLHERGESRLARELLEPILGGFSEPPCNADLGEATDLMRQLGG